MTDDFARSASSESLARVNLLARMGTADEVARVVEFLALDAPSYLTASTVYVDGGQTAMALLP
jgi:NAD(P)-dependent dehydrogenase (short-subunit alcohol dehydrogenase family)